MFAGVIALADGGVEVTVGLESETITLTAGGVEVGNWTLDECAIKRDGDGNWVIQAENDALPFQPDDPEGFARTLGNGTGRHARPATMFRAEGTEATAHEVEEGPPPRQLTRLAFYALSALTASLGLWAGYNLIF
jgi:hypothetical protein